MESDIGSESRFLPTVPLVLDAPLWDLSRNIAMTTFIRQKYAVWYGKTSRMVRLPDGEEILKVCLFVLTEFTNGKTDGRTDRHRMTA